MKKVDAAYMAALIDGEGYFTIEKYKDREYGFTCKVGIVNTHIEALQSLQEAFGGRLFIKPGTEKHKSVGQLVWHGLNSKALVKAIRPFLRFKKEQAAVYWKYLETMQETTSGVPVSARVGRQRTTLHYQLAALNKRGPSSN